MQIIAGQKRGAKLVTVQGDMVRPTAQRTRESLFNILQGGRLLSGLDGIIALDLFAGSGALGLEALSRGASQAYFVEKNHEAIASIKQNARKLDFESNARIIQADCTNTSRWLYAKAGLVFCDPPYDKGLAIPAIMNFNAIGAIEDDALIVLETRKTENLELPDEMQIVDERRYGIARVTFCRYR